MYLGKNKLWKGLTQQSQKDFAMNRSRSIALIITVVAMLLGFAIGASASLAPSMESNFEIAWEGAWETAWEIAWEAPAEFTVEFSGDVNGELPLDVGIDFSADKSPAPLELSWGIFIDQRHEVVPASSELVASFGMPFAEERSTRSIIELGKLYVEITPADARVSLLNSDKQFVQGIDLTAGQYVIEVQHSGYESQVRRVEILPGMAATVRMDLMQVAEVGNAVGLQPAYAPPAADSSTAEQLAKNLATPDYPMIAESSPEQRIAVSEAATAPVSSGRVQFGTGQMVASAETPKHVEETVAAQNAVDYGILRVTTEPANAKIRVLGIRPKFEQGMKLEPGTYTVDAKLFGRKTVAQDVVIKPGLEALVHFTLPEARTGKLFVNANMPDATIRILDIKPKFEQGMELPEGTYTIDAASPGYETKVVKVEVVADQDNQVTVELEQPKGIGRLFVKTDPADATIRVLDIRPKFEQGMELAEGTYTIDVTVEGRDTVVRTVTVVADQDNVIELNVPVAAAPGKLFVETKPSGANIRILNIKPVFQQGMELQPGRYTIDASIEGYQTVEKNVVIESGAIATVSLELPEQTRVSEAPARTNEEKDSTMAGLPNPKPEKDPLHPLMKDMTFAEEASPQNIKAFDIEVFLAMARLALNAGDFIGALSAGEQVLALDPKNNEAFQIQAQAYDSLHQYDAALDVLNKALALTPENKALLERRKNVLENKKRNGKIEETSEAISFDPGYYAVFSN